MSFIHFVTHIDYGCSYKMFFLQSCATNCVPFFNIFFARKSSRGQNCRSWSWDVVQLEVAASVISIKCLRHSLTHLWLVSNATDAKVLGPLSNLYLRKSGILTVRLVRLRMLPPPWWWWRIWYQQLCVLNKLMTAKGFGWGQGYCALYQQFYHHHHHNHYVSV